MRSNLKKFTWEKCQIFNTGLADTVTTLLSVK